MFSGLQGHSSAGGHGGGYPDGKDWLSVQNSCVVVCNIFALSRISATGPFSFFLSFQVATDVIKEFAADGVKYLELRSTPREERSTGME